MESRHWDDASPSEIDGYSLPETEDLPDDIDVCVWPLTPALPVLIEAPAEPVVEWSLNANDLAMLKRFVIAPD